MTRNFAIFILALVVLSILGLLGLGIGSVAHAATAPPTLYAHLKFTWTAPTTGCTNPPPAACDNVSLNPAIVAYEVFFDTKPIPDFPTDPPTLTVAAGVLTANIYPQVPQGTLYYAAVRARNGDAGDMAHTSGLARLTATVGPPFVATTPAPAVPGAPALAVTYSLTP